jgi:hypothetical protein
MNVEINKSLDALRLKVEAEEAEAEPGEGEAENPSDAWNAMESYLNEVLDALLADYEMTDDEALDFVFSVADDLAAEGKLPEFPDDNAEETSVSEWMGKATTMGFQQEVMKAAEAEAE